MLARQYRELAAYNRWANARLFQAALAMPDDAYRRPTGVFFGSLHGTLNHILLTDRIWLRRLTGVGEHPNDLAATVHDDRAELAAARISEDQRIIEVVDGYDDEALRGECDYRTTAGKPQRQVLADILLHLFNHETHHRGHAHACCSIVASGEPPSLDLLAFQRGIPAPDLRSLL